MPDRHENNVDEKQIKITLPMTIGFAVGCAMIVATGLASYYGNRLAIQENFGELSDRLTRVEAKADDVEALAGRMEKQERYSAGIYQGVWILLHDRGYDADKILSKEQ